MTTYVNFVPSTTGPFQFQATLDGAQYNVSITQNVYGQRYYVNVYDLSGSLIVSRGMNSSTAKYGGTFTWTDGTVSVALTSPHWIAVGAVANLTASDTDTGFDGQYQMLATGPSSLSYPLSANPGGSVSGNIAQNINFIAGYLNASGTAYFSSTLVYRDNTRQFEVTP